MFSAQKNSIIKRERENLIFFLTKSDMNKQMFLNSSVSTWTKAIPSQDSLYSFALYFKLQI